MLKTFWLFAMAAAALPAASALSESPTASPCEIRMAMSASCPCVWSAMIYNLSSDARMAIVEEKVRTTHPELGSWGDGQIWTMVLPPWGRSHIGCRDDPVGGVSAQCGAEHAWDILSCEPVEPQS